MLGPRPPAPLATSSPGDDEVAGRLERLWHLTTAPVVEGTLACPLVALEAGANQVPARMDDWRSRTTGAFRRAVVPGSHDSVLTPEHLPTLREHLHRSLELLIGGSAT